MCKTFRPRNQCMQLCILDGYLRHGCIVNTIPKDITDKGTLHAIRSSLCCVAWLYIFIHVAQWFIYNLSLWVLGLAVSNINESQLQTYESETLFSMTSLQYYCIPGLAGTRWNKNLCAKDAGCAGNKITGSSNSRSNIDQSALLILTKIHIGSRRPWPVSNSI